MKTAKQQVGQANNLYFIEPKQSTFAMGKHNIENENSRQTEVRKVEEIKKNRRQNSKLSMIDFIHAKKVSTGNIGNLK